MSIAAVSIVAVIVGVVAARGQFSAENPLDPDVLARGQHSETVAWCQINPENAQDTKCPEPLRKAGEACLGRRSYAFLKGFSWEARTANCPTKAWKNYAEDFHQKSPFGLCTIMSSKERCFALGDCEIAIADDKYGNIVRQGKCPLYSEVFDSLRSPHRDSYLILVGGEGLATGDESTYVKKVTRFGKDGPVESQFFWSDNIRNVIDKPLDRMRNALDGTGCYVNDKARICWRFPK